VLQWSRRHFLASAPGLAIPALALAADEELLPFADYDADFVADAQAANPRVKSFDLRRLTSMVTPADEFFVFHQTRTIEVDPAAWRLRVGGLVKRPAEFSLDALHKRPGQKSLTVTIECSGNFGEPRIMNGLVSTANWTGIGLAEVLRECAPDPEAREVIFLGMDHEDDRKFEAGNITYSSPHGWSLYIQDALSPEHLLAFGMNGRPLAPEHGFPLRLVMPGWYGMSQIKWLTRIEVVDRPYEGRQKARNYQSLRAMQTAEGTVWLDHSISRNNLKSVVARVTQRANAGGFEYRIAGAAWGGRAAITTIEVKIDEGAWQHATIDQRAGDAAWVLWSLPWTSPAPGEHIIVSRALNTRGEVQPTREEMRERILSNREDYAQWPRKVVAPA